MNPRPTPIGFAAMMIRSQRRHEARMARNAGVAEASKPLALCAVAPRRSAQTQPSA